jgi:hypothetical protein
MTRFQYSCSNATMLRQIFLHAPLRLLAQFRGAVTVLVAVVIRSVMVLGVIVRGGEIVLRLGSDIVLGGVMPVLGGAMAVRGGRFLIKCGTPVRKSSNVIQPLCYGTIEMLGD